MEKVAQQAAEKAVFYSNQLQHTQKMQSQMHRMGIISILFAMTQRQLNRSDAKMQCLNSSFETCRTHSMRKKTANASKKNATCERALNVRW